MHKLMERAADTSLPYDERMKAGEELTAAIWRKAQAMDDACFGSETYVCRPN